MAPEREPGEESTDEDSSDPVSLAISISTGGGHGSERAGGPVNRTKRVSCHIRISDDQIKSGPTDCGTVFF